MGLSRIIRETDADRFHSQPLPEFDASTEGVYGATRPLPDAETLNTPGSINDPLHADIRLPTSEELEKLQNQAREEGFESGRTEGFDTGKQAGYEEGLRLAREEMATQSTQLRELLTTLTRYSREREQTLEEELLALCISMTRQVMRRELQLDPDYILSALRRGLDEMDGLNGDLRLFLHPDEEPYVREQLQSRDDGQRWSLHTDPDLSPGGCRLESGSARLDLDLNHRLETVIAAALGEPLPEENAAAPTPDTDRREFS